MEEDAGRLHLHPRPAHRNERAHRERQGRGQSRLGQGQGHPSCLRRRYALRREHRPVQARVQEPADPGHRHGLDARHQPGRRRGDEFRAHHARPSPRPLARRSRKLLIIPNKGHTTMDVRSLYESKLTTPDRAVAMIPSGSKLSMGMAMAEPPALLKALADRAEAGRIEDLKVYYFESTRIAGETILRYELIDRVRPYCMFIAATERALIKRAEADGGRKVINYVPNNFHQTPRLLIDEIGIDTFVCTVSPMDRHGYFSFGTGNDYSTKVARATKRLIVEVNENMPRVSGVGAELHVSEVDAIVEHPVPLLELPVLGPASEGEVIGRTIARLVPDGACLQMGVGALPNLVCAELKDRNDLVIHTQPLNPALLDLLLTPPVHNRPKAIDRGKTVFTFAM